MDNHYSHESKEIFEWIKNMGIYVMFEPAHVPILNLTEWNFGAIKAKERKKGIYGSMTAAVNSLVESIEDCIGCNWKKVMKEIGYIDAVTDSDLP